MRRCTMVFYSTEIGSKIRQHHTLHIHFIQVCLEIKQSLYSSRHKRLHFLLVSCLDIQSHRSAKFPNPKHQRRAKKLDVLAANLIEVRSLIAAYRANYDRLKPTKSSHRKKSVWDSIMEDFVSSCSDAGIESEKTLVQIKEKWRSLCDKYKAAKDHKKCTKIYNARAQLLFRSLNLLFGDGNPNPSQPRAITHW